MDLFFDVIVGPEIDQALMVSGKGVRGQQRIENSGRLEVLRMLAKNHLGRGNEAVRSEDIRKILDEHGEKQTAALCISGIRQRVLLEGEQSRILPSGHSGGYQFSEDANIAVVV
jgi:hypothetical protein